MKGNKEAFINYIKKYCNTLTIERTIDGTIFLNKDGKDWGNINKDNLELFPDVVFHDPSSVDDFIDFAEEKEPIKTYSSFLKENDRRR